MKSPLNPKSNMDKYSFDALPRCDIEVIYFPSCEYKNNSFPVFKRTSLLSEKQTLSIAPITWGEFNIEYLYSLKLTHINESLYRLIFIASENTFFPLHDEIKKSKSVRIMATLLFIIKNLE